MPRRTFTPEYKLEVASMVLDQRLSVAEVCQASGVGRTAVRRWVQNLQSERQGGVRAGHNAMTPEQQRIQELEAKVKRLQEDNDILKKATAFFANDSRTMRR